MKNMLLNLTFMLMSFAGLTQDVKIESNVLYLTEQSVVKDADKTLLASYYGEVSENTGRPKTERVSGYTKKNGTYVRPYYRSSPKLT